MKYATALLAVLFALMFSLSATAAPMGGDTAPGAQGAAAHGDVIAYEEDDEHDEDDDEDEEEDW